MSQRMTKMEACHHLTVIRDEIERECVRYRERIKSADDADPLNNMDSKRYAQELLREHEAKVRAIDMAGAALTR